MPECCIPADRSANGAKRTVNFELLHSLQALHLKIDALPETQDSNAHLGVSQTFDSSSGPELSSWLGVEGDTACPKDPTGKHNRTRTVRQVAHRVAQTPPRTEESSCNTVVPAASKDAIGALKMPSGSVMVPDAPIAAKTSPPGSTQRLEGKRKTEALVKRRVLSCLGNCACRCHSRKRYRSPRALSAYVGDTSMNVSNLPWCLSNVVECDEQTCRRSESANAVVRYTLPKWFTSAVATFNVSLMLSKLPVQFSVESPRTIPYCSPVFKCVERGDLGEVQALMVTRKSSICDADPYGLGLLYYATYYCWRASGPCIAMNMCKALLDMGVNADQEDEIGNTPCDTLIDQILVASAMQSAGSCGFENDQIRDIAVLFKLSSFDLIDEYRKSRQFTPVHNALLCIDEARIPLDELLTKHPEYDVDMPDAIGRTPLAWAAEHGWPSAVDVLLRHGANATQTRPCKQGPSPLLHLVIAAPPSPRFETDFLEVIRLLVTAGAGINATDADGWTPLHVAASWSLSSAIKTLGAIGGGDLDVDAKTNDGETAMDLALLDGEENDDVVLPLEACRLP